MKTQLSFLYVLAIAFSTPNVLNAQQRWQIDADGSIRWEVGIDIPHYDHIEMSGQYLSAVLRYGVNADGSFSLERSLVWPMLRTIPNNTHASLMRRFGIDFVSQLQVNGRSLTRETVHSMRLNGLLTVVSELGTGDRPTDKGPALVELTRTYFPAMDQPVFCERYAIKNISDHTLELVVPTQQAVYHTDPAKGVSGSYTLLAQLHAPPGEVQHLKPGEVCYFDAAIQAYSGHQAAATVDVAAAGQARTAFVDQLWSKLVFDSPDETLNTAFAFAKIRAAESIFKTKGGYMHGPGGESYYAAIWANDQAEYINPFFPFLHYDIGNASALNAFRHFARFMNPEYKPIPSSIIAEGDDTWGGAGDRGDAAMIAYGAARYALARADREEAEELWPLIEWCLEFSRRKINDHGVVESDSDELEGRFPAGDANLCTSSLYYDALLSAAYLAEELQLPRRAANDYRRQAKRMRAAIEQHFGATVEGFETYRYYEGNDVLRSWICIPLTVGIYNRAPGTIDALFSPRLWTNDGLLTQAGTETFWDRSTLYALRGVFAAGEIEKALAYLQHYSATRLRGEHVPYPIEAWPEGSQRHLSAESALFCRIFIEGIFGIRPTGFQRFSMTPQLPEGWDHMELKQVGAFGEQAFDIRVERQGTQLTTTLLRGGTPFKTYTLQPGETIEVAL
ncbi:hypothetical protein [Parapedobacter sp. 10938]|uniref:hypothetical protein n=1 Tax=Parapedobacter flavus TaxID=3110225 RepID=UPI002DC028C6|nr:hypothetical protein [Parapedobacter sp. 10938]MEC3880141.1 hypothetical protein [Parapedobacter sp. 10938]